MKVCRVANLHYQLTLNGRRDKGKRAGKRFPGDVLRESGIFWILNEIGD